MFKSNWWLFLAAACCPSVIFGQARLSGVVHSQDGEALHGASLVLEESLRIAYSRSDGGFDFGNLPRGTYVLRTSYLGYETRRDTLTVEDRDLQLDIALVPRSFLSGEVVVEATRLSENSPGTFETLTQEDIAKRNLGQDIPYLLALTPSMVTTSDAGAGVGYTGLRIRGSDQTRINLTVNGVPINDPESQVVVWVNMPDLATSLNSVQIQRGLGSSTNGSGAFGASINMETGDVPSEGGGLISNSFGSFNTRKHTVEFNTGRLKNGFAAEGRLSSIQSDGYIDRATSDLKSYYLSAGYFGEKTMVKAVSFAGAQETYQSWYGTPESRVKGDREEMLAHAEREGYSPEQISNLLNSGRTYNHYLYENEVDNYTQSHYQLHVGHAFSDKLRLNLAGHYTRGDGFFEQYKAGEDILEDFGKPYPVIGGDTVMESDFIIRRWLANDFYGGTYALKYVHGNSNFTLGGGLHFYRGDHFGEILWADSAVNVTHGERYYDGVGNKDDYSVYGKWEHVLDRWNFMLDLQLRSVEYETFGIDNDLTHYDVSRNYLFFNPKLGVRHDIDDRQHVYAYFGRGHREPVRNDFIDADPGETPRHETLNNLELGYGFETPSFGAKVNGYLMHYENQLVLTGALNDTGNPIRENVDRSYRAGFELQAAWRVFDRLMWSANFTYSRNKITEFEYHLGGEMMELGETDISFSPEIIAANNFVWMPVKGLELALSTKYVGEQFLDNTSDRGKMIDAYTVSDFRAGYTIKGKFFDEVRINLLVNNIFDAEYSSNGYTYSYVYNGVVTENFYYPQAGTNFLIGLDLVF